MNRFKYYNVFYYFFNQFKIEKSLVKSLNNIDKIGPLCLASQ